MTHSFAILFKGVIGGKVAELRVNEREKIRKKKR